MSLEEVLYFKQLLHYMAQQQQYCSQCELCQNQRQISSQLEKIPQEKVQHETKTKIFTPIDNKTFFMANHQKRKHEDIPSNLETSIISDGIGCHEKKIKISPNKKYNLIKNQKSAEINHRKSYNTDDVRADLQEDSARLSTSPHSMHASDTESENGDIDTCSYSGSMANTKRSATNEALSNDRHRHELEKAKYERNIKLYQYLIDLLEKGDACVMWISRKDGMFKIMDSDQVARLWGEVKLNPTMTYEKLARSFRHYYKKGIMESDSTISKTGKRKLYYKFGTSIVNMYLKKTE